MGQRPEMNGEMPQLPEMGSEAPQDLPEMNGEMPQMPEKDKGGRQGSGSAPEGAETAPENTENSGVRECVDVCCRMVGRSVCGGCCRRFLLV